VAACGDGRAAAAAASVKEHVPVMREADSRWLLSPRYLPTFFPITNLSSSHRKTSVISTLEMKLWGRTMNGDSL